MSICLDCGDEMDDFNGTCSCSLDSRATSPTKAQTTSRIIAAGGMRAMKHKQMARAKERKEAEVKA